MKLLPVLHPFLKILNGRNLISPSHFCRMWCWRMQIFSHPSWLSQSGVMIRLVNQTHLQCSLAAIVMMKFQFLNKTLLLLNFTLKLLMRSYKRKLKITRTHHYAKFVASLSAQKEVCRDTCWCTRTWRHSAVIHVGVVFNRNSTWKNMRDSIQVITTLFHYLSIKSDLVFIHPFETFMLQKVSNPCDSSHIVITLGVKQK